MNIRNQKDFFNNTYECWKGISDEKRSIILKTLDMLGISEGHSVLDVAAGTGVLYSILRHYGLSNYAALDISENMLKEIKEAYPEVQTICADFDKAVELKDEFDFIIIFNSIPHFENLDMVFANVKKHLRIGGTFAVVHPRTRKALKEHHKRIGFALGREAIPSDEVLSGLLYSCGFRDAIFRDEEFFFFTCKNN